MQDCCPLVGILALHHPHHTHNSSILQRSHCKRSHQNDAEGGSLVFSFFCRDLEDPSISRADKQRDYMQHLDNVMLIAGEDKSQRHLMPQGVQDFLDRHKGADPALYGDFGYLILLATAADAVSVFALELHPNARLQPLIPEFVVRHVNMP